MKYQLRKILTQNTPSRYASDVMNGSFDNEYVSSELDFFLVRFEDGNNIHIAHGDGSPYFRSIYSPQGPSDSVFGYSYAETGLCELPEILEVLKLYNLHDLHALAEGEIREQM